MLTRRIARPLLASIFISGGLDAIRNPGPKVAAAEPVIDLVTEAVEPVLQRAAVSASGAAERAATAVDDAIAASPLAEDGAPAETVSTASHQVRDKVRAVAEGKPLPFESETYVRINGAVQVGAGVLLAIGKVPRIASAALAVSIIPTTFADNRFWEQQGAERDAQKIHFTKNVSLLGGLLLAAVDTEGQPGLAWRARHARSEGAAITAATRANAAVAARVLKADAKAARRLAKANSKGLGAGIGARSKHGTEVAQELAASSLRSAGSRVSAAGAGAALLGQQAAGRASDVSDDLMPRVRTAAEHALELADELRPKIRAATTQAAGMASELATEIAQELAPRVQAAADRASGMAEDLAPKVQVLGQRAVEVLPSR